MARVAAGGPPLKRRLTLPLLTLYGMGTTIGAGIFVLVGSVAGSAGAQAPLSFLIAALLAAPTALAFGELAIRHPRSAGEAVYAKEGLRLAYLPTLVGLLVVAAGLISAAAISRGFVGYLHEFVALPEFVAITGLVLGLGLLAAWGILESVAVAALLTLFEIGALLIVIAAGAGHLTADPLQVLAALTPSAAIWPGVMAGSILAFYAFIGFEDMVNVAEEVRDVGRTMPLAILLTLLLTGLLYLLVSLIAVVVVPPAQLAASDAPLSLVYQVATGGEGRVISLIALFAVLNGALIQIIMASRVLYGLSGLSLLPALFGRVNVLTGTPLPATALVTGLVLLFALTLPIVRLAEITSFATLLVFAVVNLSLAAMKIRGEALQSAWSLPLWVPLAGFLVSAAFAIFQSLRFAGLAA